MIIEDSEEKHSLSLRQEGDCEEQEVPARRQKNRYKTPEFVETDTDSD